MRKIVFFGHHKCGSRLFRRHILPSMAARLGAELVEYQNNPRSIEFWHLEDLDLEQIDFSILSKEQPIVLGLTNSSASVVRRVECESEDFLGLHVIRDPRQILVSNYFHHREGHPIVGKTWVWKKLELDRPYLQKLSQEEGLIYELSNITGEIFETQLRTWRGGPRILELRLEDVTIERQERVEQTLSKFFGLGNDFSITLNSSTRYENPASLHWSAVFTPALKEIFKTRYGDLLVRLGYEQSLDW